MYKWKEEIDFRNEVENFKIEEDARRSHVEEGTREDLKDNASEQKDSAKRYKFSWPVLLVGAFLMSTHFPFLS